MGVVKVLDELRLAGRQPEEIRMGKRLEFVVGRLMAWCQRRGVA